MASSKSAPQRRTAMVGSHLSTSARVSAQEGNKVVPEAKETLVQFETDGHMRIATLTRESALNALNLEMIQAMKPKFKQWGENPDVKVIVLKGSGRAFCSGGDVVSIVKLAESKDPNERKKAVEFFKAEYELDAYIAKMKTPVVCLLDGITMGGGLGISVHTPFRVATEKTRVAMPETTIGLFPDVGASFFLPRMDGELGTYLGLTSENVFGWGALQCGIASHYVPSASIPTVLTRLSEISSTATHATINSALNELSSDPSEASLSKNPYTLIGSKRLAIDHCFSKRTVEGIVKALSEVEEGTVFKGMGLEVWARETRETVEKRSPSSCKVTLVAVREGKKLNIDQCFEMDMRLAAVCCDAQAHPDFVTGVSHLLIQKQKTRADWSPATLPEVKESTLLKTYFSSPPPPTTLFEPLTLSSPGLQKAYHSYPHAHFSLPSETDIQKVVTGDAKESGSFALTKEEVCKVFEGRYVGGKVGVREKVLEVLERRTRVGGVKEERTLKWVH